MTLTSPPPCICSGPGFCSRMHRQMGPVLFRKCQTRDDYRALWDSQSESRKLGIHPGQQPTEVRPVERLPRSKQVKQLAWEYGVTTVPDRFDTLLPRTLDSLEAAGFDKPRLFVDGTKGLPQALDGYPVTFRYPRTRTFGNWMLSLWELYVRNPWADRYAIFQDDFVTYRNLRSYLDKCDYPTRGYWNLYTFPINEKNLHGWYTSNQRGLGAVALVFNREAVTTLLSATHMVERPQDKKRGHRAVDGGIVTSFKKAGWREYVHNPSLVQHTGDTSTMGNGKHELATSFRGEDFDALELLKDKPDKPKATIVKTERRNRIGMVGYNCASGIGELNRQLATYIDVNNWLVKPHAKYKTLEPHPDVDTIVCPKNVKTEMFLKAVDTIVFCETPFYTNLVALSKKMNRRLVCIPMQEWMPSGGRGWPLEVDLFICPTKQCYDQFKDILPCVYFPWPVDVDRFPFQQREKCERFLFVNGHGGWGGRKGADVVKQAKKLWPEMPLLVRSQIKDTTWPAGTEFATAVTNNRELYSLGDVLLVPHSVDGLGLEPMEAMAAGMPVISTDGEPWNEIPSIAKIAADKERRTVRRPVDWYLPSAESLVEVCQALVGRSILQESDEARHWAESRSWNGKAEELTEVIRFGAPVKEQEVETKTCCDKRSETVVNINKSGRGIPKWKNVKDRWNTFRFEEALGYLNNFDGTLEDKVVVEIGAIRTRSPNGPAADGYSTMYWAKTDCTVHVVDTSQKALDITRQVVNDEHNVIFHCEDGVKFLQDFDTGVLGGIDLLYLDGPDPDEDGQQFALRCFQAADLAESCVVLIDDCDFEDGGKGKHVAQAAIDAGFEEVPCPLDYTRQLLFLRTTDQLIEKSMED